MSNDCLKNLEPKAFFQWFCKISQIPRPSRKEHKFIAFLEDYARKRKFPVWTDEIGNVFMTIPATAGYEAQPSILFQAHVDIVPNKDEDKIFDFETEALQLFVDGDKLTADGTILGADNGVGIATMLAIGDSSDIPHPELEFLFTVSEEVGLVGIRHFDLSKIRSRRMLNMDCGSSHDVCVCSAGKISSEIRKEFPLIPIENGMTGLTVFVSGINGGHAAAVAKQGRACAPSILAALLMDLPVQLFLFKALGDTVYRKATADFAVAADKIEEVEAELNVRFEKLKESFFNTDPHMTMEVRPCPELPHVLNLQDSADIIKSLYAHRTQGRCPDEEGRITASSVIMEASFENGTFKFTSLIRALDDNDAQEIFEELQKNMPISMTEIDRYSGWPEKSDSQFKDLFNKYHKQLFGNDLTVSRALGGLEVGPILGGIPEMDAVGYAPSSFGAHTTSEYLQISEAPAFWEVLKAVLAHKK